MSKTFSDFLLSLEEDEWSGTCCTIPNDFLYDIKFTEEMIDHEQWKGTTCCIDKNFFNYTRIFLKVINSDNWDGETKYLCSINPSTTMIENIISSKKWNGSCKWFGESLLNDRDLFEKVISSEKWDKNIDCFGDVIKNDEELMMKTIIKSNLFSVKNFLSDFIYSDLWNGSVNDFPESFLEEKQFTEEVLLSDKWDGDFSKFKHKGYTFACKIIHTKHFSGSIRTTKILKDNEIVASEVINCPNWDGDASAFNREIKNNVVFFNALLNSPYWDGNLREYGHILKNDLVLKNVIKCKRWNAYSIFYNCPGMTSDQFCEMMTRSTKWDSKYYYNDISFESLYKVHECVTSSKECDNMIKFDINNVTYLISTRLVWDKFMYYYEKSKDKNSLFSKYRFILDSGLFYLGCAPKK